MARPDSIRARGFKNHLEATKNDHNGFGYREWCILYDAKVNLANLARAFNVSSETVTRIWLPVFIEQRMLESKHNQETLK